MQQRDNLLDLVKSVFRRKKQIIRLCAIAGIGAIIISIFLPNYYESTSTFYAASSDVAKPGFVGPDLKERALFGKEEDMEKIMTCASSTELVDYLITEFGLYEHYDINPESKKATFKVREALQGNMTLKKTKYEAIELSIEDKEPEQAAKMVNAAVNKVNAIAQKLTKSTQAIQIENKKNAISEQQKSIRILGDSLSRLSQKYGIYNVLAQSESISELLTSVTGKLTLNEAKLNQLKLNKYAKRDTIFYLEAQRKGLIEQKDYFQKTLHKFNEGSAEVSSYTRAMKTANEQYSDDQERLKQLQAAYNSNAPMVLVLEQGEVPVVKSRPKRSILVIGAVLITFIFCVIFAILMDAYKDVNWKEIVNAE